MDIKRMGQASEILQAERPEPDAGPSPRDGEGSKWTGLKAFTKSVAQEMKRVSWPNREEVSSTTTIVIIAVAFFGFFLWGVDNVIKLGLDQIAKWLR
jgi:preprotein translocase SecE subunit